jgi:hypothetical protein
VIRVSGMGVAVGPGALDAIDDDGGGTVDLSEVGGGVPTPMSRLSTHSAPGHVPSTVPSPDYLPTVHPGTYPPLYIPNCGVLAPKPSLPGIPTVHPW